MSIQNILSTLSPKEIKRAHQNATEMKESGAYVNTGLVMLAYER